MNKPFAEVARRLVLMRDHFDCKHRSFKLVSRELSNGSFSVVHQCIRCGSQVGTAIKQKDASGRKLFNVELMDRFDNELKDVFFEKYGDSRNWCYEPVGGFVAYRRYLESDEWKEKRAAVLERDENRCVLCGEAAKEVHHVVYSNVYDEPLRDLISLCSECHEKIHGEINK